MSQQNLVSRSHVAMTALVTTSRAILIARRDRQSTFPQLVAAYTGTISVLLNWLGLTPRVKK